MPLRYLAGQQNYMLRKRKDGGMKVIFRKVGDLCYGESNENRDHLNISSRPDGTSEGQS